MRISSRTRVVISRSRPVFSRTPSSSIRRRTGTSGSSISSMTVDEVAVDDLLALPGRQLADEQRLARELVLDAGRAEAALLEQLAQRVAAARGLEQVGAQQRVVGEVRRHDAERLGVVGDDGALAGGGDELRRVVHRAGQHLAAGRDGEAPRALEREQLALGDLGRARGEHELGVGAAERARRRASVPGAHARADLGRGDRRGRGLVGAEELLQAAQRVAQLELAEDLAQLGAVGHLRGGLRDVEVGTSRSRRIVASTFDIRAFSAWLSEVLLALGAGDLVDRAQHALEVAELLQQLRRRLVADPGHAGDVVARVALQAVEVGDQLGRDAVAVDDRGVVVELRVGDPARGRHDADEALGVDELEGVAVAGDDHRRDAPARARARPASR